MGLATDFDVFERYVRIWDYFGKLKIKVEPEKLAFISQDQQDRKVGLLTEWRNHARSIRERFGDEDKIFQSNIKIEYDIRYMDLMIECLRENGWEIE